MSFLLGAALFAGALIYFVLHPVLNGQHARVGRDSEELTDAEALRRVTLGALRDVEYDHETGKLDDEDYRSLRKELSGEALAALDAERHERRASDRFRTARRPVALDLEAEIRRVREGLGAGTACRECGHLNRSGSRFCSACGEGLAPTATPSHG
jgi:cytochrome c-type biogenesis protein CcmI